MKSNRERGSMNFARNFKHLTSQHLFPPNAFFKFNIGSDETVVRRASDCPWQAICHEKIAKGALPARGRKGHASAQKIELKATSSGARLNVFSLRTLSACSDAVTSLAPAHKLPHSTQSLTALQRRRPSSSNFSQ